MLTALLLSACVGCGGDLETRLIGVWNCVGERKIDLGGVTGSDRAQVAFQFDEGGGYAASIFARLLIQEDLERQRRGRAQGRWRLDGARIALTDRQTGDVEGKKWIDAPDRALDVVEIADPKLVLRPVSDANDLTLGCERVGDAPSSPAAPLPKP